MFDQIFRCMSSIRFSISDNKRVNRCRRLPPSQHPMLLTNLEGHNKTSLKHDKPPDFFSQIIHHSFDVEPSSTNLFVDFPRHWSWWILRIASDGASKRCRLYKPNADGGMAVTGGCFRRGQYIIITTPPPRMYVSGRGTPGFIHFYSVPKTVPGNHLGGIKEFRDFPYYNAFFGLVI